MDTKGFKQLCFCECKSKIWEFKEKNLTWVYEKGALSYFELGFTKSSLGVIASTTYVFFLMTSIIVIKNPISFLLLFNLK
jgi:hypothetical protein